MPELPEVETIRIGLEKLLPGKVIEDVWHDWPKSFPNAPADVDKFMIGSRIKTVKRRAKVLIINLSSNYSLVIHLKMTGQLVYVGKQRFGAGHPNKDLVENLPAKATRVIIEFKPNQEEITDGLEQGVRKQRSAQQYVHEVRSVSTGAADNATGQERWRSFGLRPKAGHSGPQLFFNDQRKFGWMRLLPTIEIPEINFFKTVGPEPLEDTFTYKIFSERLMRRKNSGIKSVLLDQTVIAGIGNIYADESLWLAKIHPLTPVYEISRVKLELLHRSIREILSLSIKLGGSTDKNYVDAEGKKGSYLKFAQVFRQEGQPCPRCGTEIIKIRVAGRGTHICPKCQKP